MARFAPILATDPNLEITVSVEPEDMPVDMQSGDPEYADADAALEREIIESANSGNEYAWCYVRVTAAYTDPVTGVVTTGEDSLGAVSCLPDEARNMSAEQCFEEAFAVEMRANALDDLNKALEQARQIRVVRCCITECKRDGNGNSYVTGKHVTTRRRIR